MSQSIGNVYFLRECLLIIHQADQLLVVFNKEFFTFPLDAESQDQFKLFREQLNNTDIFLLQVRLQEFADS